MLKAEGSIVSKQMGSGSSLSRFGWSDVLGFSLPLVAA
jgi:hypothetical protein